MASIYGRASTILYTLTLFLSCAFPAGKYDWFEESLTAFKPRSKASLQGINLVLTILATPLLGISSPPFQSEVCKS